MFKKILIAVTCSVALVAASALAHSGTEADRRGMCNATFASKTNRSKCVKYSKAAKKDEGVAIIGMCHGGFPDSEKDKLSCIKHGSKIEKNGLEKLYQCVVMKGEDKKESLACIKKAAKS